MKTKHVIPLLAMVALLAACKGKNGAGWADSSRLSAAKQNASERRPDTARLVKKADIRFKVKDVQETGVQIAGLTTSLGGTVVHHTVNSTSENSNDIKQSNDSIMRVSLVNVTADMTVKIPPANLESFMLQVSKMGLYIDSSHMDIKDRSLDYLSNKLKLKNEAERAAADHKSKSADEMLAFKNNMVEQQIKSLRTEDSVKTSVITLNFYESKVIHREIVADNDLSAYNPPILQRLSVAVVNGWNMLVSLVVAMINAWIIFPSGVAVWALVRYIKKKKPAAAGVPRT